MNDKFINLKINEHEIIKLQHTQAALKFMQNKKLFYHINSYKLYKFCDFFK